MPHPIAMPQDAFTLRLVAEELNAALSGGKINKIVQPSKDEVSLCIYTGKGTVKLILNTNASDCGAYFGEREAPAVPPNFCMLLRKHLSGAELLSVSLVGFERVMRFRFLARDEFVSCERELYLEVMGKYSNLLLVQGGILLGALKTGSLENAKRMIFPGVKYTLPAKQDKADPSDMGALRAALGDVSGDVAHAVFTRLSGIAPVTAEQIAAGFHGGDLAEYVHSFLFETPVFPCVSEAGKGDFFAVKTEGAIPFPSLLEAESYLYARRRSAETFGSEQRKLHAVLSASLKKAEKKRAVLLEKELSCRDADRNRLKGELLTANLWQLSRGMTGCTLPDYTDPEGKSVNIPLDGRLSPAENAQAYFKKYRKQQRTLSMTVPQIRETEADIEYLQSVLAQLDSARERDDLLSVREELEEAGVLSPSTEKKRAKGAPLPYRIFEREGFTVLAGRNNLQNDRLVRSCSPEDIWLHAQRYHSCHAVVRTEGREVPLSVLQFAADLVALHSDGGGDKIPVDYTFLKHVKKPKGSKAGFVTYTAFKTLLGDPEGAK